MGRDSSENAVLILLTRELLLPEVAGEPEQAGFGVVDGAARYVDPWLGIGEDSVGEADCRILTVDNSVAA